MNATEFLDMLNAALTKAAILDADHRHDGAKAVLEEAVASSSLWTEEGPEEAEEQILEAVRKCSRESERQHRRSLLLRRYLQV